MSSGITLIRVGAEEINDFVGFEEQLASYIKDSLNRVTRNEIYASIHRQPRGTTMQYLLLYVRKRSTERDDCRDKRDHLVNKSLVDCTMATRSLLSSNVFNFTEADRNECKAIKRPH